MRRVIFLCLGVLEFLVALVLLAFAWQLPGPAEVHDGVGRVEKVGKQTGTQVRQLRAQLHRLRERRPQLHAMAVRLQEEMRTVTDHLRAQQIDYDTVRTVSDALGDVASGLDGLAQTLDPKGVAEVGAGLKAAADYLEEKVAPAAAEMARNLDGTTADLKADAERLASLLRAAPVDLRAAREVYDSLARFDEGLDRMDAMLKLQRADAMKEGFKGLEDSLSTGAEQVERLSGYTYPYVRFEGLRPVVDQKQFWPEGGRIAEGMRKAAKGASAAGEELEQLTRDLPKLRQSLAESRKVAAATRETLGKALAQQEKVETLLRNVPEHAARLAEELPRLAAALGKVLRDTGRLKEVATLLRHTQRAIDGAVARWPELQKNLGRSAVLLRATQGQLKYVLEHRTEYEASLKQTLTMSRTVSATLPLLTEQLEQDLEEQEQSLDSLGEGIEEVNAVLPGAAQTASRLLQTTRLLLLLLALTFSFHGGYLVLSEQARVVGERRLAAPGLDNGAKEGENARDTGPAAPEVPCPPTPVPPVAGP
jgi:chromosome segregation ATPase